MSMLSNSNIDACDADEEDLASGSGPSSEPFQSKKPRSSVRFEKKSMMAFIEYPSHSELQRRWDTKAEVDMYKRKLVQERNYISRKMASTSQIETDDLILCIGMEKILSINVCKEVKRRQKQHVLSILEEQARQELCNVVDVEPYQDYLRIIRNGRTIGHISWLMVIGEIGRLIVILTKLIEKSNVVYKLKLRSQNYIPLSTIFITSIHIRPKSMS